MPTPDPTAQAPAAGKPESFPLSVHHLCVLHDVLINGQWWHVTAVYGRGYNPYELDFAVEPLDPNPNSTRTRWGAPAYSNVTARWTVVERH